MAGVPPADEDRLPWLEPYRDGVAQKQRIARRSHGGLVAVAAALGVLFAAGGGFWLGQRADIPTPPPPSATVALPPPKPAPVQVAEALADEAQPAAEPAEPAPSKVKKPTVTKEKAATRKRARSQKVRSAGIETARRNAPTPSRPVRRPWPKMPSPGPAGQVIQLGAFSTPTRAASAYRVRIARYPLLGRMPRVIVPVATQPTGRVLYVLRLGTTSRQQSKTVCRNLRRSGDHCLVIG